MKAGAIVTLVLGLLLAPEGVGAQLPDSLVGMKARASILGTRASARAPRLESRTYYGTIGIGDDSTFVLMSEKTGPVVARLRDLRRLEITGGTRTRGWDGVLLGSLIAGGAVGTAAVISELGCEGWFCFGIPGAFAVGFTIGAIPGSIIGGLIGRSKTTDRWVEYPIAPGAAQQ